MASVLIQNGTLITEAGERKEDVLIEDGIITAIEPSIRTRQSGVEIIDAQGLIVMPGLIDCHVHFREPGLTHKATMESESASAIAGGVTTVCEMPNTKPPTVTIEALQEKVRIGNKIPGIDIRFFFGATEPKHLDELQKLFIDDELNDLADRCCGLKLYFDHSTGNQGADKALIEKAFALCAELDITVVCHCEDAAMNETAANNHPLKTIADHSRRRPPEAEAHAIADAIGFARTYGTHFHVAHLSTKQGLDHVRAAKKEGLPVTCEVAPHHLFLSTDDYAELKGFAKMNPPLRSQEHVDALWKGVTDGAVDCIATDHAPHTLEEKTNDDLSKIPSGVPGVETMLPLLLTKLKPKDVLRLCFTNPNSIFDLGKEGLVKGASADVILVDAKKTWKIHAKDLHSKCMWTPFENAEVRGKVVARRP